MSDRVEAYPEIVRAGVAAALGGAIAAFLAAGAHDNNTRAGMVLSSAVSLTAGLYGVYGARKRLGRSSAAVAVRAEPAQRGDAELKREPRRPAAAAFPKDFDASAMEIRMTGSLKSIMAQAEQGLVASDAEKARHLAAIWSMAACDLDDDPGHVAH